MTAVLVTGGAGFIGSHACKALARAGYTPIAYDNLSRGHAEAVKWGPLEVGDIGDRARLRSVLASHRPAAAIHFANYAYATESMDDPLLYYDNNVARTAVFLAALREADVNKIIFSSSCATYGVTQALPITEETPQYPINPYGAGKAMIERMLADCGRAHGLGWVTLRFFNAAGCDPDGDIGEDHDPETHLIPRCLMVAAGEIERFDIFGTDYPTRDGSAVRDYVHVCDLADSHVAALRHVLGGKPSMAINLGSDRGFSVREVVAAVERVTGRSIPVNDAPRRPGDPPFLVASSALAVRVLGFTRRLGGLDEMIASAWRWHGRDRGG